MSGTPIYSKYTYFMLAQATAKTTNISSGPDLPSVAYYDINLNRSIIDNENFGVF